MRRMVIGLERQAGLVALVALMLGVVTLTGARAMIVPEVAAVSAGFLVFQVASWRAQPVAFWLVIVGAAFAGAEVTRYLAIPLVWQIAVTLAAIALALLFFRLPAWPALSAGLLPVYLHLRSPLYVVGVAVFMALPVLAVVLLEHAPLTGYAPLALEWRRVGVLAVTLAASVALIGLAATPLVLLPPLLVAAAERAMVESTTTEPRTTLVRVLLLAIGVELSILGYVMTGSLFVVLVTVVVLLVLLWRLDYELGPALALSVIPLVFTRGTDERIAYLIPAGIVLTQVLPRLLGARERSAPDVRSTPSRPALRSVAGGASDARSHSGARDSAEPPAGGRALVVGGGSAIARAILVARADTLSRVVLLGPHRESLEATAAALLAQRPGLGVVCDVLDLVDEASIAPACERALTLLGGVELVMLAAGRLEAGEDPDAVAASIRVNFLGPAVALSYLAPRVATGGQVVVLSSVAGERVRPVNYVYGAAKAGLDGFALALGERMAGKAHVLVVRPGFVRSPMTAGRSSPPLAVTPERVARDVVRGLDAGATLVWSPPVMRVVMSAYRHVPRRFSRLVPFAGGTGSVQ